MTTLKSAVFGAAFIAVSTCTAFAHDLGEVSRTQLRQIEQIVQGRNSGQLTRREYNQLMAEQTRIAEMQAQAQREGYVSRHAYHLIREAQTAAASHIYTESHDGEKNYWRVWQSRHGYR